MKEKNKDSEWAIRRRSGFRRVKITYLYFKLKLGVSELKKANNIYRNTSK